MHWLTIPNPGKLGRRDWLTIVNDHLKGYEKIDGVISAMEKVEEGANIYGWALGNLTKSHNESELKEYFDLVKARKAELSESQHALTAESKEALLDSLNSEQSDLVAGAAALKSAGTEMQKWLEDPATMGLIALAGKHNEVFMLRTDLEALGSDLNTLATGIAERREEILTGKVRTFSRGESSSVGDLSLYGEELRTMQDLQARFDTLPLEGPDEVVAANRAAMTTEIARLQTFTLDVLRLANSYSKQANTMEGQKEEVERA